MLAAILGAMVLLACVGLFSAIDRQTIAGQDRFRETLELSTTHGVAERAIHLLVMSDSPPPVEPTERDGDRETAPEDPADPSEDPAAEPDPEPAAPLAPPEPPRFTLAFDPALSGAIELFDGRTIPPQRLEVALRAAPIFVPRESPATTPDEDPAEEARRLRRERRAREDAEVPEPQLVEITTAPGIRGVFELVELPARDDDGSIWELWWRQVGNGGAAAAEPVQTDGAEIIWPEGMAPGAVRLATDLSRVHWQVFRGGEWLDEWTATWPDDLPAYVQLEVATIHGTTHQWLLEVGWTTGKDPGTQTTTPINTENPAGGDNENPQAPGGAQPLPAVPRPAGRVPAAGDHLRSGGYKGGQR
jgi:hypothetical protein